MEILELKSKQLKLKIQWKDSKHNGNGRGKNQ